MKRSSQLTPLLQMAPGLMTMLKQGDLAEAILIDKEHKIAYFDLGRFGTGIVYGTEFRNAADIIKNLNIGDKVSAKVLELEGEGGYIEVSLAAAGAQKAWQEVKELQERGEVLKVKITGANSGGLIGEIKDIKAFMPVSQLATEHYPRIDDGDRGKILEELKKLISHELEVKIIDANSRTQKLIISEREAASAGIKELISKYKVEDVIDGIISGVADFGAFVRFVDNPAIEGLIHISELSHRLIESPKEVVRVDDAVKVKIIEIKDGRVWLSLKALQLDPWLRVEEKYKVGGEVVGVVSRYNPFGAFIGLDQEIQGLIHVSEFGGVEEMKKQIEQGKSYAFIIDAVKPTEKRILLRLKK